MLDAKSVKLKKIDEDILELMIETNCTQEAYNIEFEAIEGYTEKMIAWQVRVKNIMKTDALGQKDNHSLVTSSSSSLRLPKIQFQQFSGELTDWLRFHNQFKRIHEDESIDDGDKFQYLIQATTPKSRARDIVESFPATPENYRKAFEYLRMRFGQEDVLIQVYIRELLKLVLQNAEVNKINLSSLYDKIEAQLRALESLGVTKEKYAAMLFPLVESCLPAEILRAWERYVGYSSDESGLETESASIENSTTASSSSSNVLANQACTSEEFSYRLLWLCCKTETIRVYDHKLGGKIEILLGADVAGKLLTGTMFYLKSGPVAIKTKLGWTLMGKTYRNETKFDKNHFMNVTSMFVNDMCISDLWKLDSLGITDPVETKTKLEIQKETLNHFQKTISVDISGRYEVALPWVLDNKLLSSNRKLAENRLESTKRKLIATGKFEEYQDVLDLWLSGKIIEEVNDDKENFVHYLPHRPVIKENSTSKIRPVFDASARTKGSPSLHDCLEKGPNFIEVIPTILNRFRKYKIGVISDIEKAFLQIGVRKQDRDFEIYVEIWKLKLEWDENLPKDILNQVKKWLEQLPILASIKIPRCLNLSFNGIKRLTLHVFCDASKKAYAACVFLRVEYEGNVFVKLIQAKARVAPLKDISIPRLELLACVLGTRLAASVKNDLNLPDVRIYYLTDSMTDTTY
ncbi:integrase catalytic domain-containing protein [Trichonephila clavipes]|nr:integrase catalytic domain-containing protein [Trichonephila clavipes]